MNHYIKEFEMIREVLFALQGLNGRIIRQDEEGRFTIIKSHITMIDPTQRMLLEKLTSFGWLVNKIKNHISTINKDPTQGKVSQCLAAALHNELLEYYHMVTQIEQQLQKCANTNDGRTRASTPTSDLYGCLEVRGPKKSATYESLHTALVTNDYAVHQDNSDDGFGSQLYSSNASPTIIPIVTLHQIHVWSLDHYFRLKTLAMLVECCKGTRGGNLARIVYRFMQQGDKQIRAMIARILNQIVLPIRHMLFQWIFHGEIVDPYDEFTRLDEFISPELANKISATGKAIHMLRKFAPDSVGGYDDLKKSFETTNIESLFRSKGLLCEENDFENLLTTAYREVSQKSLELLFGTFKLRNHFRGLRQYLFLGQGDFIRHLMDLLQTELDKPAGDCKLYNISSVLDTARRSTNAQFEDLDVIDRIDCRLLEADHSEARGWDIFSLYYRVDGPISTIFTEEKVRDYMEIFRFLWRTKRVEHVITSLWSSQMYYTKYCWKRYGEDLPLISAVFHRANILLTKMQHFIQHFQNFIMFEVVECSWVELLSATDVAKDHEEVIAAHNIYLDKIKSKIKLGTMCQKDAPFDCIIEFQKVLTALHKDIDTQIDTWTETEKKRYLDTYGKKIIFLADMFRVKISG